MWSTCHDAASHVGCRCVVFGGSKGLGSILPHFGPLAALVFFSPSTGRRGLAYVHGPATCTIMSASIPLQNEAFQHQYLSKYHHIFGGVTFEAEDLETINYIIR